MCAYTDLAVEFAIAVARVAGLPTAIGRTASVVIEAAVRSAPYSTLPVFRNGLVLCLSRRELETSEFRPVARLG